MSYRNQPDIKDLISHLNPHFINNALQWLQLRLKGDEQATTMISKLAENFSMVFNEQVAHYARHTLSEELRLIDNYLYIQQCRYGDKLEFDMPDRSQWKLYQHIPVPMSSLLHQVEVAVEDRIRVRKDGRGKLTLTISEVCDGIEVLIDDEVIVGVKPGLHPLNEANNSALLVMPATETRPKTSRPETLTTNRGNRVTVHLDK
jgi:LytS/YehU family sensor histidine kinase